MWICYDQGFAGSARVGGGGVRVATDQQLCISRQVCVGPKGVRKELDLNAQSTMWMGEERETLH